MLIEIKKNKSIIRVEVNVTAKPSKGLHWDLAYKDDGYTHIRDVDAPGPAMTLGSYHEKIFDGDDFAFRIVNLSEGKIKYEAQLIWYQGTQQVGVWSSKKDGKIEEINSHGEQYPNSRANFVDPL